MTSSQFVLPTSELAGAWQLLGPLLVNGLTYTAPDVIGFASVGYLLADNGGVALNNDVLTLPDVGIAASTVTLVGTSSFTFVDTYATTWAVPLPTVSGGILASDHVEIISCTQEAADVGPLNTPSTGGTWTLRGSWFNGIYSYNPRVTKWWRKMAGGETGNITVTGPSSRPHFVVKVWRGVHRTQPYDTTLALSWHGQGGLGQIVDPAAITTITPGAVIDVSVAANNYPAGPAGYIGPYSEGYHLDFSNVAQPRYFIEISKRRDTPGLDNPSPFSGFDPYDAGFTPDNFTAVTDALKPASGAELTLLVATAAADDVVTTLLAGGSAPVISANEVQKIQSGLTAGTFTLTYSGQTTSAIAYNATAATIVAALIALSNIGVAEVTGTGGPLNQNPVVITFAGTLANTDQPLMTTNQGTVTVSEVIKGHPVRTFTAEGSINIPPSVGSNYSPQVHLWTLTPPDYVPGATVDITVSNHAGLHAWAALLLVIKGAKISNPISDTFGSANAGLAATAGTFGTITPATPGMRALAFFAMSGSGFYGAVPPNPSTPDRYEVAGRALSSAANLAAFLSPPLRSGVVERPSGVVWAGSQDYATGIVAIDPAGSAGTLTVAQTVGTVSETTWAELSPAAGSMFTIFELDLTTLPVDAFLLSARVEFAHKSGVRDPLRMRLVGITAGGVVSYADEVLPSGYLAEPLGLTEVETGPTVQVVGEAALSTFPRLGIAFISSERHPALESHQLFWARAEIEFEVGRPIISNLVGPATAGASVTWTYSSSTGLPQGLYRLMIIAGTSQNPLTATAVPVGVRATTGQIIYDSGEVVDPLARSLALASMPLGRGACTVALMAWGETSTGQLLPAAVWATANFDVTGTPPTVTAGGGAVFDPLTGLVAVTVIAPAGVSRGWLMRSADAGATWTLIPTPFTVVASTTQVLQDAWVPLLLSSLTYAVAFDNGPMTETTIPQTLTGTTSTVTANWYLVVPASPALSTRIEVAEVQMVRGKRSVTAEQPGGSVTATSKPLAQRLALKIRVRSKAERLAVNAALDAGLALRVIDVFGREWLMRPTTGTDDQIQRWAPVAGEITGLRDGHILSVALVEVRR
jgi:hypothetical protein